MRRSQLGKGKKKQQERKRWDAGTKKGANRMEQWDGMGAREDPQMQSMLQNETHDFYANFIITNHKINNIKARPCCI